MSKQANPTLVGVFVVGAITLLFVGLLIFGGGKYFEERHYYVMYFKGSVKGLDAGANVKFRGVKIGTVEKVAVRFDEEKLDIVIPVLVAIEPGRMEDVHPTKIHGEPELITLLIKRGMRAQLQMQSMVTGKLFINIDFYPKIPPVLIGAVSDYQEIPTIPSTFEVLMDKIANLKLDELVNSAKTLIQDLDKIVSDPETQRLAKSMNDALHEAKATVKEYRRLAEDGRPIEAEFSKALKEIQGAARAIRVLTDYLQQNPSAVIFGKGRVEEK